MYEDTYFLNGDEALRVASLQNKTNGGYVLQVCYYSGEKIESEYPNLIHLPIENLVNDLAKGDYRIPAKVDFTGLDISASVKLEILQNFNISLEQARDYRNQYNAFYLEALKNAKLDFSEPLRFYLLAASGTRVMQHISKNIANALQSLGCEVLFVLDIGINDLNSLKKMAEFNPHATININHINNAILGDDVFNFIWIQDHFAIEQFKHIRLRKRDFVFNLNIGLGKTLQSLKIKSTLQQFCIDTDIYKKRVEIKKEKKIVFIGSSYKNNFDNIVDSRKYKICDELQKIYLKKGYIGKKERSKLLKEYKSNDDDFRDIINYIERDLSLTYILKLGLDYKIDVYGYGWEDNDDVKPYFKGILSYGEDISKIYNSAEYGLVIGGYVMQQRTLESAASGTIPLVFDSRNEDDTDACFDKSILFFKKLDDLKGILSKRYNFDLNYIASNNSYKNYIDKILDIIKTYKQ